MKALYLDCAAGINGNMFLGACIQLGVPEKYLRGNVSKAAQAFIDFCK